MAQLPVFLRYPRTAQRARPPTHIEPLSLASEPLTEGLFSDLSALPASARLSQRARPKIRGLGQGERRLLRVAVDCAVLTLSTYFIFSESIREYPSSQILFSLGVTILLWLFLTDAFDTYKPKLLTSKSYSIYNLAQVLVVMAVAYILISWFAGGFLPVIRPRISEVFMALLVLFPLLLVRTVLGALLARGTLRRRVAVVGANRDGSEMVDALLNYPGGTYDLVGRFDVDIRDEAHAVPDPNGPGGPIRSISELLALHSTFGLDQIVLANPTQTGALLHTLSICHERGVQITPMFALYQDLTGRVPVAHLGHDWFVAFPANVKHTARSYLLFKRMFDLVAALVGLVLAAPLLPLVAAAIKLDSPGPVFFRQSRVGLGGRPFSIVKFRSMRVDAEAATGAIWATRGDARITRVGRFLRKSRLDEIPQLWNVLLGEMSFVGPRPERPEFDEQLEGNIPFYRARRAVRPGLTGWAQIRYGYGNTIDDARLKVEYDLYYIKNQSLYLDMLIMLRTVAVIFRLRGT